MRIKIIIGSGAFPACRIKVCRIVIFVPAQSGTLTVKNLTLVQHKSTFTKEKLVFAVQFHDHLDILIVPYLVHINDNGEFTLSSKRIYSHTLKDYPEQATGLHREAVKILDECRDDLLLKRYSKTAKTPAEFFEKLTEPRLKNLVIPFVQKRTDQILRIFQHSETPLYFKGFKKDPVRPVPIPIQEGEATAVFNFSRLSGESRYHINLRYGGKEIPLNNTGSHVLANKPGWILAGGRIYLLEQGIDGNRIRPFVKKDFISIPVSAEEKYFKGFVAETLKKHEVAASGFEIVVNNPVCEPVIRIENDLAGRPVLVLYFNYGSKKCQSNNNNSCWVDFINEGNRYRFEKTNRDPESERKYVGELLKLGLTGRDGVLYSLPAEEAGGDKTDAQPGVIYSLVDWLGRHSETIEQQGYILEQKIFKKSFFVGRPYLDIGVKEERDWFDVKAFAVFGEFRIPFIRLKDHLLRGEREFLLPDGKVAVLPEEWFARYKDFMLFGKDRKESVNFEKHHFSVLKKMDDRTGNGGIFSLSNKEKLEVPEVPVDLAGILRPYQVTGYAWMYFLYRYRLGGCLADDMGLGKTVQTLALLTRLKTEFRPGPIQERPVNKGAYQLDLFTGQPENARSSVRTSLIVMPLSLLHNWEDEIRKFAPGLRFIRYSGAGREELSEKLHEYDLVLTTYGIVRNDLAFFMEFGFFYLILDESQIIKNPKSKTSRAIRRIRAENRLVLTGTPIENSLSDLWAQMSLINPGLLGSHKLFMEEFVIPVEKNQDEGKKEVLRELIEPFILRRTKALVAKDLPELTEKVYYCEMSGEQKRIYETRKSEIRNMLLEALDSGGREKLRFELLRGLMQLRLIANHPAMAGFDMESGKFGEVIRNLESLRAEGHKLLIFSQFVKHLKLFREYFDRQTWKYSWLTGEQNNSERQNEISRFQDDPENMLFLISLRAGGVGLNLTAADYVFILDPWWNPAVEKQAISRAHRIGQGKKVFSYKFISGETVEEKIVRLQEKKSALAGEFINTNNPLKIFTDKEIIGLFE
jgi:superfamily II DNA or RNA helicase